MGAREPQIRHSFTTDTRRTAVCDTTDATGSPSRQLGNARSGQALPLSADHWDLPVAEACHLQLIPPTPNSELPHMTYRPISRNRDDVIPGRSIPLWKPSRSSPAGNQHHWNRIRQRQRMRQRGASHVRESHLRISEYARKPLQGATPVLAPPSLASSMRIIERDFTLPLRSQQPLRRESQWHDE